MATFTNQRSGESLESTLTNAEAAAKLAETAPANSWIWFWVHKMALEAIDRGQQMASGTASFVADSFVLAIGYGLQRPKIRVHYKNRRYKLYMSRRGTICLRSGALVPGTHDPSGSEEYVGCSRNGKFLPAQDRYTRVYRTLLEEEREFLRELAAAPVAFLAQCSKDMGSCCYCGLPLEDARSKLTGYGPVCAKRWGLPWGHDLADEKVPSFARSWDANAAAIIATIREEPNNGFNWSMLADWLEEHGLPRCKQPNWNAVLPQS